MNKNIRLVIAVCISVFMSCNDQKKADVSNSADDSFQTLSKDFIAGYLKWRPELAVSLGFHEYDGKISQFDKSSLDIELTRLKNYDHRLEILDTASLTAKMFYDYRILRCGIKSEIFNFED